MIRFAVVRLLLEDRVLYCNTNSIIYRHVEGMYNLHLREFVGGMTGKLGGSYITGYVSNGPKNYAYRTGDGVKCFTSNCVASQQLTLEVMKEIGISEQDEQIIVTFSEDRTPDV